MALTKAESAYYTYLTERMGKGESKNIIIPTAVDLIKKHLLNKPTARLLDIGCFNGTMLNQIRLNTTENLRHRVQYSGAELDESLIKDGKHKYPDLKFERIDLDRPLPDMGQYDIVILSNVLHEIIPNEENIDIESVVGKTIDKVSLLTTTGGDLLILDGLKPNNDNEEVKVCFASDDIYKLYKFFAKKYSAFKIQVANNIRPNTIQTRIKDLAAFMTKARYLFEDYWSIESKQIYQYFNQQQFTQIIEKSGFRVQRFEPQRFTQEYLNNLFSSISPYIEYPAKNVLIVASKIIN